MLYKKFSLAFFSVLAFTLPEPLSQQDRDRLREIGRQNAAKYGNGPTSVPVLRLSPTPVPTATPTLMPSPTIMVKSHQVNDLGMLGWFINLIMRVLPQTGVPIPTPILTPTMTVKHTSSLPAEYYWNQGFEVWLQTKDYKKAGELYRKSLAVDPNYPPALASYGYLKGAFMNDYAGGVRDLQRAMQLDPNWAYAPYNLALLQNIHSIDIHDSALCEKSLNLFEFTLEKFKSHPDWNWFNEHYQVAAKDCRDIFGK